MEDDPFSDHMSYEELQESKPEPEEILGQGISGEWYNEAPYVAARLIVRVAREHDEFRQHMLDDDEFGSAHEMGQYDADAHEKLNTMGLSAMQGGSAESMARSVLSDGDEQ